MSETHDFNLKCLVIFISNSLFEQSPSNLKQFRSSSYFIPIHFFIFSFLCFELFPNFEIFFFLFIKC